MAGDWIKMRVGLTTNPRVMRLAEVLVDSAEYIAWSGLAYGIPGYPPSEEARRSDRYEALRVTRYVAVTALLRFWGYANEHVKTDFIAGVFREDVDEIVGIPGFAVAIETVGWVEFKEGGGIALPNFSEHNTSAGARSGGAERQKRYRERKKNEGADPPEFRDDDGTVTRDVTVTHREEKRREEREKRASPRGERLPHDAIPQDWRTFCQSERPDLDPDSVFARFADYWRGIPGAKGRKSDWAATWRNWVRDERRGTRSNGQAPDDGGLFAGAK